jgi:hypothetical protein
MGYRSIDLTPYIECSIALRRLISICTYSPLLASAVAASTLYIFADRTTFIISYANLLISILYCAVFNLFALNAVMTRRSFAWLVALSGIGIVHTPLVVAWVIARTMGGSDVLRTTAMFAAGLFLALFASLVAILAKRALRSRAGLEILPGSDFNDILRRIRKEAVPPSSKFYAQELLTGLFACSLPLAFILSVWFAGDDPLSIRALLGVSSGVSAFVVGVTMALVAFASVLLTSEWLSRLLIPAPTELLKSPALRPVVLVRAFEDDTAAVKIRDPLRMHLWARTPSSISFETVIPSVARFVGPLVAIGQPQEGKRWFRIHLPGRARRSFVDDASWQGLIDGWFERSALIVAVWGSSATEVLTPGLSWELQQIRDRKLLHRLAVLRVPIANVSSGPAWTEFWRLFLHPDVAVHPQLEPSAVLGICFDRAGIPLVIHCPLVAQSDRILNLAIYKVTLAIMVMMVIFPLRDLDGAIRPQQEPQA